MSRSEADTLRTVLISLYEKLPGSKTCGDYEKCFFRLAGEYKENGSQPESQAAAMLGGICSMMFNIARTGNPWGPVLIDYKAGRRSLEADDLESEQLAALAELVPEIQDPELKARIADVLWTRRQGYQFGQTAITAYSEDGGRPDEANRPHERVRRLERAADIARKLGREKLPHISAFERLDNLLDELFVDSANLFVLPPLLDAIFDHRLGEAAKYIDLCESAAGQCSRNKEWNLATRFWEIASSWHHRQGQDEEARRCRQAAAWEMIARGRDADGRSRYGDGYSAAWILKGITALKNNGGDKTELEALYMELAPLQQGSLDHCHSVDLDPRRMEGYEEGHAEHVEMIKRVLSGKTMQDAIHLFCGITQPTDVEALRSTVMEGGAGLITQMIGMVATDSEGKETDVAEGIGLTGEVAEADLLKRLYEHARTVMWPMACDWFLEPGRKFIAAEHSPRIKDLVFLVAYNPFIPPGHEGIFLRGIHAGFEGDFLLATHFLVPQLEGSLRRYLKHSGVVTWVLKDGLQKEQDLGGLLSLPKTRELLGEDLVFDLRGLLTEKFGENVRHDMAHGNMPEVSFYRGAAPLYSWWLILRMVWIAFEAKNAGSLDTTDLKTPPATE